MTTVCLTLAELALRFVFPLHFEHFVRTEYEQNLPGVKRHIVFDRNDWGLRSVSMRTLEKPPKTVRILVIGASTTEQPTQSTADTWTGLLETRLNGIFDDRIEVAAMGRGGQTVRHGVSWLREHLEELDPDLLVTLEGVNDLAWLGGAGYRYEGPEEFSKPNGRSGFGVRCRERLQLCRRLVIAKQYLMLGVAKLRGLTLDWHSESLPKLRLEYRSLPHAEPVIREPDPAVEFRDGMNELLSIAATHHVRVVVLEQPVLWSPEMTDQETDSLWFGVATPAGRIRPSGAWLLAEMRRFNAIQSDVAKAHGARFVPLDGRIPKDRDHFFDDCHLTDLGSRKQADLVLPVMAEEITALLR